MSIFFLVIFVLQNVIIEYDTTKYSSIYNYATMLDFLYENANIR
ncbi:hypothetical protein BC781_10775 [Sediminitomix flava]|uniref:Uncharacterized protein n=1 Tax=Sediminitomix flava TaxID=379075 RepID=A0A315Z6V3_SEDFL|nr:hypothetical protein BC781_10775 [Sediminitomix flava]